MQYTQHQPNRLTNLARQGIFEITTTKSFYIGMPMYCLSQQNGIPLFETNVFRKLKIFRKRMQVCNLVT
jgi:hypothetical protein